MSSRDPRWSVVIPCRDDGDRLLACLDALDAQDMPRDAFEVIVVDGGSAEACASLAQRPGIRVLRDPGDGPARARNIGVREARGEFVAFTDADCVPRFDWLSRLDAAFRAEPDAAAVAGGLRLPRSHLAGRLEDDDARVHYGGYITSNIAYRREAIEALGGFDEALQCAEDYDLAWRALDLGHSIAHEPAAIVLHDAPEVGGPMRAYLEKQFWYARNDVPAHAGALRRALRAGRLAQGSRLALSGSLEALGRSVWAVGVGVGIAARSPLLVVGTLAIAGFTSAPRVASTLARAGDDATQALEMTMLDAAKKVARGFGTLVGLLDLARDGLPRPRGLRSADAWTPEREPPPRVPPPAPLPA